MLSAPMLSAVLDAARCVTGVLKADAEASASARATNFIIVDLIGCTVVGSSRVKESYVHVPHVTLFPECKRKGNKRS